MLFCVACNILSAHSHKHDDFFQPFVPSLCRARNTICMCHGSGAISSLFLLVILRVATVEIHECRTSIASAPTTASRNRQRRNSLTRAEAPSVRWSKPRPGLHSWIKRSSRVDDLAQQMDRWWILVHSGGRTSGTAARRHGPTGVS